jgi:hypothetical protein
MLRKGHKHPLYSLDSKNPITNPYSMWIQESKKAKNTGGALDPEERYQMSKIIRTFLIDVDEPINTSFRGEDNIKLKDSITGQVGIINSYGNWFLASKEELDLMCTNLVPLGLGGFTLNTAYWSSSEIGSTGAHNTYFHTDGGAGEDDGGKSHLYHVRACRSFTSNINYNIGDINPIGGFIFYKNGNNYLESALSDQSVGIAWSNIQNVAVTGTLQEFGTGQANTTAIINQVGHITSAAKLCDDLVINNP